MKFFMLRLSVILVLTFILILGSFSILFNTETGSRWLLKSAIKLTSSQIHIGKIEGRLYKTIVLHDLNATQAGTTIRADKIAIDWHIKALMNGKFSISRLTADTLSIKIKPPTITQHQQSAAFKLPMKIHFKQFEFQKLIIDSPALTTPFVFNNTLINAKIYPELLSVQLITRLTDPTPMNIRLDSSGKPGRYQMALVIEEGKNHWALNADGDFHQLHFSTKQNQILGGTLTIAGDLSLSEHPQWLGKVEVKDVHPELLFPEWTGTLNLNLLTRLDKSDQLGFLLDAQSNETRLKLDAKGPFKNLLWDAKLNSFILDSPLLKRWHLKSPTAFSLAKESLRIAPLCLVNDKNTVCFQSDWKKGSTLNAEIQANKVPLEMLNPWLGDMSLRGDVNMMATLKAARNQAPDLKLFINFTPGVFYYTLDEVQKNFHYRGGQITAELDKKHFTIKSSLELLQNSKLTLNAGTDAAHWNPEQWLSNPMQGNFQIVAPQLDFLAALIPSIALTRGSATAHGTIGGNLEHPIIMGSAKVNDASFTVPDVNGSIKKLSATGSLQNWVLSYQGTGMAGEGNFKISGTTQLIKKQLHTQLALQGKNMLISDTPGVKVIATPDLQMKIVDKVMLLTGKIFIPKGEFRSYDYNDVTELPDEISYKQATPLKPENEEPVQLTSLIDMTLGNNISIDSNGLKGKLSGTFAIRDVPGGATTAQGSLSLSQGKYDFRGQKLTVERGVLNFNGGPVNNPNLNVRAVRYIGTFGAIRPTAVNDQNRMVGINITGTLAKHKLTLFSEPDDISQTDILSYLVLGQSMSGATGSTSNATALLGAAQALNLTETGSTITKLKSQIEQKLGLSELDITSYETKSKVLNKSTPESTIQHTAFVLGRYLSPKLYVNYSFDILDHTNVFRIRYFLNKKWSVQSESSWEGNALDILYSFEKG